MTTWRRVKRQVLSDRHRLGIGVMLCCVALLLWGRLLIKKVPRTATADPKVTAEVQPQNGAPPTTADNDIPQAVVVPRYGSVHRDLFAFDPSQFPKAEQSEQTAHDLPKSTGNPADDLQRIEQEIRRTVLLEGRNLKLQSTLMGSRSQAMINGVLLEPGEKIQGFELIEVKPRQVKLVKHEIEVVLEM